MAVVRLDPWHRIVNVGWGGQIGVLQVTMPDGIDFTFSPFEALPIGPLADGEAIEAADLTGSVNEVQLSGSTVVANLYDETETLWIIDSVVFPDSPFSSEAEYDAYKAGYVPPDQRFQEVADVRTLGTDVRPGAGIDTTPPSAWPPDGTWSSWAHYDGFGPLPPTGEPFWGLGQHSTQSEVSRDAVRAIWLFDFGTDRIGSGTITVANPSAEHDDRLASYSMSFALRIFPRGVVLTRSGLSLSADLTPLYSAATSAAYDQAGTLFSFDRSGLL